MNQLAIRHNIERYQSFVVRANIVRFTNLLRTTIDADNRRMILSLLAQERAKLKALTPDDAEQENAEALSPRRC